MNRLHAFPVLALALTLPLAAQGDPVDLSLNVKAGSSIWVEQMSTQSQVVDMGGQEMASGNSMRIAMRVTVKEVTESGIAIIESRFERVRGSMELPMIGGHSFDSIDVSPRENTDPAEDDGGPGAFGMPDLDAIGRAACGMAGTTLIARVNANGKVESIDGLDPALAKMNKTAGPTGAQMLMANFNEKAVESMVQAVFGERPAKPVAVGSTWERTQDPSKDAAVQNKLTMKLAAATAESFEVTGEGTIEKVAKAAEPGSEDESDEEAMMREMQSQLKIENGVVKGRSLISRQDGFIIEAVSDMSMDLKVPSPLGGEMDIKQTMKLVTKRTTQAAAMAREADAEGGNDGGKDGGK